MPEKAFLRLLTAPETFRRLNDKDFQGDFSDFLSDSVEAEYYRAGIKFDVYNDVWSALGHCYFARRKPIHDVKDSLRWSKGDTYFAPILKNGIPGAGRMGGIPHHW